MSSTNKTANYQLSQFTADDKPSWLGDYNSDNQKIDTALKSIDSKAESAETNASNANSSATQALETANKANTKANGADTNATNALSLATTANDNASTAKQNAQTALQTANTANGLASSANSTAQNANTNATKALNGLEKFNFTNFKTWNNSDIYAGQNISDIVNSTVNLACDDTASIFKLYGEIGCTINANSTGEIILSDSPLRPSEEVTIGYAGLSFLESTPAIDFVNVIIKTNGQIVVRVWNGVGGRIKIGLFNCLYFLDAFKQILPDKG